MLVDRLVESVSLGLEDLTDFLDLADLDDFTDKSLLSRYNLIFGAVELPTLLSIFADALLSVFLSRFLPELVTIELGARVRDRCFRIGGIFVGVAVSFPLLSASFTGIIGLLICLAAILGMKKLSSACRTKERCDLF